MHNIYRSTFHVHAARLVGIGLPPAGTASDAPALVLTVETGETFGVSEAWAEENGVRVGGYVGAYGGINQPPQVIFIPADRFADEFELVADTRDEVADPAPIGDAVKVSYDFDQFIKHGIDTGAPIVQNGMPWSFSFHGRPVTHENDDLYLIGLAGGGTLNFRRGEVVTVGDAGGLVITPGYSTVALPDAESIAGHVQGGA